jgi:hypothetical protein
MKISRSIFLLLVASLPSLLVAKKDHHKVEKSLAILDRDHSNLRSGNEAKSLSTSYPYGYPYGVYMWRTTFSDNFHHICAKIKDVRTCKLHDACSWFGDLDVNNPKRVQMRENYDAVKKQLIWEGQITGETLNGKVYPLCFVNDDREVCYRAEWHAKYTDNSRWNW